MPSRLNAADSTDSTERLRPTEKIRAEPDQWNIMDEEPVFEDAQ